MGPLRLENDGVVLREIRAEDWLGARALDADPRVTRYLAGEFGDEATTRRYIAEVITAAAATPRRRFELAVTLAGNDDFLGRVCLNVERPEHREATMWYVLRRDRWGQRLASRACRALVAFGFAELGLHRIWGDADPRNEASLRVMERLGFRREGHLRENYFLKGEWCDSVVFAILEGEWAARR